MYWAFKTQEEVRDGQTSENSPYCANIRSSAPRSFTLHTCFTKLLLALLQTQPRDEVHQSGSNSKTLSKVHSSLVTCYRYIDRFLPNSRFFHSTLRIYVLIFSLSKTTKFQKAYSKPFQKKKTQTKEFQKILSASTAQAHSDTDVTSSVKNVFILYFALQNATYNFVSCTYSELSFPSSRKRTVSRFPGGYSNPCSLYLAYIAEAAVLY